MMRLVFRRLKPDELKIITAQQTKNQNTRYVALADGI
jgi:hypothetical protein